MADPRFQQAINAYKSGQFKTVQSILEGIIRDKPDDEKACRFLGNVWATELKVPPDPQQPIRVNATPANIPVGGAKSIITVLVVDPQGKPAVDGAKVSFSVDMGMGTFFPNLVPTSEGVAQTTLISDTKPGVVTVTASSGNKTNSVDVIFTPGPPHSVKVNARPGDIPVNEGESKATALVRDQFGNPVVNGIDVKFTIPEGSLDPDTVSTVNGRAQTTITSGPRAGRFNVSVEADGVSGSTNITFSQLPTVDRCLVCDHLISRENCPVCGADNHEWWGLDESDYLERFPRWLLFPLLLRLPPWLRLGVPLVFFIGVLVVAIVVRQLPATILAIGLSVVLAVIVYIRKLDLRKRELLRQVKTKKRGPGLVGLAAISLGLAFLCSLGVAILLWLALAYMSDGEWAIMSRNIESRDSQTLYAGQAQASHLAWSPDGATLVYASNQDGDWDIHTVNSDGSERRNLTNNDFGDFAPSWSQDGSRIVFTSDRNGKWQVFDMDINGRNLRLLVDDPRRPSDPALSPDGKRVAYVLSDYSFSFLLGDQIEGRTQYALYATVFGVAFVPFLTLALMLIGVKGFIRRLDEDFPRPLFLDTDRLTKVVLKSVYEHLGIHVDGDGLMAEPYPLPIDLDARALARTLETVINSVEGLLKIPDEKKYELELKSVVGHREGGLGFLFERQDERRRYWVESDWRGELSGFEDSPRLEALRIVSVSRTEDGGLKMVVGQQIESREKEKSGEYKVASKEKRYDVETDEWGRILSLKEQK